MGGMTEFGFPSGCIVAPVTAWRRSLVSSHAAPVWSLGGAEPTGIPEASYSALPRAQVADGGFLYESQRLHELCSPEDACFFF